MSTELKLKKLLLVVVYCGGLFLIGCGPSQVAVVVDDEEVIVDLDPLRPSSTDILQLRNGDQLTGTILNKSFSMRTSYAQIDLNSRKIARISLEGGINNFETISTINNNRFSGLMEDPVFVFKVKGGARINVRREQVSQAVFQVNEVELAELPRNQFLILKNGDFFSGKVKNKELLVSTTYAQVPVKLSKIAIVSFLGGGNVVTKIVMRNGDEIQGVLKTDDIELTLDVGGEVKVYKDHMDMLYCRKGYVPKAYRGAAALLSHSPKQFFTLDMGNGVEMKFVLVPKGSFTMGSPVGEPGRDDDEGPRHQVIVTRPFYMLTTEVTQQQYRRVMADNPSSVKDIYNPVEMVSWNDATEFCRKLSERAGRQMTLPTEAQWEYACRAGSSTRFSFADGEKLLGSYCWYNDNSSNRTHPVATKWPNSWGLYDMHGNVWEWCRDWYAPDTYTTDIKIDPMGPSAGQLKVVRGGNRGGRPSICRSADRHCFSPDMTIASVGFRVVFTDF